jgi:hypothetical protein
MRRKQPILTYVVFGLIAIGILSGLFTSPSSFLIPVIIFGAVFLLYKYPPNTWKKSSGYGTRFKKPPKRKNATFRVINGSGNRDNQDEPPKYH